MIVLEGHHSGWSTDGPTAVTVGVYDGVHRGHRAVLRSLAEAAGMRPVTVVTFEPHPMALIAPMHVPPMLTSREQKLEQLEDAGAEIVAVLAFDEAMRDMEALRFIDEVLVEALYTQIVAVGRDFRFGARAAGNVALLQRMGSGRGFDVLEVPLTGDGEPLSSTRIRSALAAGDVLETNAALGRPFELRGTVVAGEGRGRTIGFPTANLAPQPGVMIPGDGVYAVRVKLDGVWHPGVVNVGTRPTFDGTHRVVEVHLLDGGGDLYGSRLALEFAARLRGEQRFAGVPELVAQIERDVASARQVLDA